MPSIIPVPIAIATLIALIALAWIVRDPHNCGHGTIAALTTACEVLR